MLMLCGEVLQQRHHHGDRRFVVGAQYAGTVAKDNLFVGIGQNFRVLADPQPDIFFTVQTEIISGKREDLRINIR
ncbi:hypothetical protein D3C76_1150500 [compost metagenome]